MTRTKTFVTAAVIVLLVVLATPPASAGQPVRVDQRELAQGTRLVLGNCPQDDWSPPVDTVCESYVVLWVRYAVSTNRHPDLRSAPWQAIVEHYIDVVHPDGSFDTLVEEYGGAITTGTYDERHLQSAHMDAVDVPLSGPAGDVVRLGDFTWTAASRPYVWGADGPVFDDPHRSWGCGRGNFLAHQRLTVGYVTGTIDGRSIDDLGQLVQIPGLHPADGTGYIFDNAFRVHIVDRCEP